MNTVKKEINWVKYNGEKDSLPRLNEEVFIILTDRNNENDDFIPKAKFYYGKYCKYPENYARRGFYWVCHIIDGYDRYEQNIKIGDVWAYVPDMPIFE